MQIDIEIVEYNGICDLEWFYEIAFCPIEHPTISGNIYLCVERKEDKIYTVNYKRLFIIHFGLLNVARYVPNFFILDKLELYKSIININDMKMSGYFFTLKDFNPVSTLAILMENSNHDTILALIIQIICALTTAKDVGYYYNITTLDRILIINKNATFTINYNFGISLTCKDYIAIIMPTDKDTVSLMKTTECVFGEPFNDIYKFFYKVVDRTIELLKSKQSLHLLKLYESLKLIGLTLWPDIDHNKLPDDASIITSNHVRLLSNIFNNFVKNCPCNMPNDHLYTTSGNWHCNSKYCWIERSPGEFKVCNKISEIGVLTYYQYTYTGNSPDIRPPNKYTKYKHISNVNKV